MKKVIGVMIVGLVVGLTQAAMSAQDCTVNAGPIWNQADANQKCPATCNAGYGPWTGQWWTTVPNQMSVCQCVAPTPAFEAGPIWNQTDANQKCPIVCGNNHGSWTGQWWTTVPNQMSVCQCAVCTPQTESAPKK